MITTEARPVKAQGNQCNRRGHPTIYSGFQSRNRIATATPASLQTTDCNDRGRRGHRRHRCVCRTRR